MAPPAIRLGRPRAVEPVVCSGASSTSGTTSARSRHALDRFRPDVVSVWNMGAMSLGSARIAAPPRHPGRAQPVRRLALLRTPTSTRGLGCSPTARPSSGTWPALVTRVPAGLPDLSAATALLHLRVHPATAPSTDSRMTSGTQLGHVVGHRRARLPARRRRPGHEPSLGSGVCSASAASTIARASKSRCAPLRCCRPRPRCAGSAAGEAVEMNASRASPPSSAWPTGSRGAPSRARSYPRRTRQPTCSCSRRSGTSRSGSCPSRRWRATCPSSGPARGGSGEFLIDGVTALVTESGEAPALADAMRRLATDARCARASSPAAAKSRRAHDRTPRRPRSRRGTSAAANGFRRRRARTANAHLADDGSHAHPPHAHLLLAGSAPGRRAVRARARRRAGRAGPRRARSCRLARRRAREEVLGVPVRRLPRRQRLRRYGELAPECASVSKPWRGYAASTASTCGTRSARPTPQRRRFSRRCGGGRRSGPCTPISAGRSRPYREGRLDNGFFEYVVKHIDAYLCLSETTQAMLVDAYHRRDGIVVGGGVDLRPVPARDRARSEHPTLLFTGTLDEPRKNLPLLLDALDVLLEHRARRAALAVGTRRRRPRRSTRRHAAGARGDRRAWRRRAPATLSASTAKRGPRFCRRSRGVRSRAGRVARVRHADRRAGRRRRTG